MTVSLCIRQGSREMMIQSVWKNLTGLQKAAEHSGVTLNADLDAKSFSVTIQHKQKRLKSALNFD